MECEPVADSMDGEEEDDDDVVDNYASLRRRFNMG